MKVEKKDRVVLPPCANPVKYEITLTPDFGEFRFNGTEIVHIDITQTTYSLFLNVADIEILDANVRLNSGQTYKACDIKYYSDSETVELIFATELSPGGAQLSVDFVGDINDRLHGFYRSTYKTEDGQSHVLAATQFEPTDARRAFPCWDEPNKKATFELTLIIPSHLTAVSNMPVANSSMVNSKHKRIVFEVTPPMSTYLLAFVVGELEYIEDVADDGTLLRVWTTPGKSSQGKFALAVTKQLLTYYNDYFGIPYPLAKLDQLAIPDFAAGAMENWGAITYREVALLFDPDNSSPRTRQIIAEVVAHEMAHMWFGDLVTMDWWDDLWLNESFASWMATKAVDHIYPEWDLWTQFVSSDVNTGLNLDGLETSHPIRQEVNDPAEINQLFDAISYQKGASILRMLEEFLGETEFRRGLRRYLEDNAYKNATGRDLWEAFEHETGKPVISIMDSWIDQIGYPVIDVEVRRGDNSSILLTQSRFLYSGPNVDPTIWKIPVLVGGGNNGSETLVLVNDKEHILKGRSFVNVSEDWIKVNFRQTGFYRVRYNPGELKRLIPQIESLRLSTSDRLGLQSDTYALSRAGFIEAVDFLELSRAYINETQYAVWVDILSNLRSIGALIVDEPYYQAYREFGRNLLRKIVLELGWTTGSDKNHLETLLRSTVLSSMGWFGDVAVLDHADTMFLGFMENPGSLPIELRGTVYNLVAQRGNSSTYDTFERLYLEASLQEEKLRLLSAMSNFRQHKLLQKTMEMALSDKVRSQDSVSLVNLIASNPENGKRLAWEYVKTNWNEFDRRYGSGGFAMMGLVQITGRFNSGEDYEDVKRFFDLNPTPSASRTVDQSLERIGLNMRWLENNRSALRSWLTI